jgi:hypothetical protein
LELRILASGGLVVSCVGVARLSLSSENLFHVETLIVERNETQKTPLCLAFLGRAKETSVFQLKISES